MLRKEIFKHLISFGTLGQLPNLKITDICISLPPPRPFFLPFALRMKHLLKLMQFFSLKKCLSIRGRKNVSFSP